MQYDIFQQIQEGPTKYETSPDLPEIQISYKGGDRSLIPKFTSSEVTEVYLRKVYPSELIQAKEFFFVIYLDRANKPLGYLKISEGGVTGTVADPRMIFAPALKALASSIILSHNHPSGNRNASRSDNILTEKMKKAGENLDIPVLDHIIILPQEGEYTSFADDGLL